MAKNKYHNKKEGNPQDKSNAEMHLAKHFHFEYIDSTNTWAKLHSDQWDPKGVTLITASAQTAGRGRFKRPWISPPYLNIYATFCFWLSLPRTDIALIPQILALSAVQSLDIKGFKTFLKWPNDLLIQEKKVAGILCETILEQDKRGIVCGIGLNVNMPLEMLKQIDRPATSLFVEGGNLVKLEAILNLLQQVFLTNLNTFIQQGFAPFFPLLQERSALKEGQKVHFLDHQTLVEAQFEHWLPDGTVKMRLLDGTSKIYHAGEFINF